MKAMLKQRIANQIKKIKKIEQRLTEERLALQRLTRALRESHE